MGRLKVTLENNGDVIALDNNQPNNFTKGRGASGFGIAPTQLNLIATPGGGARHRSTLRQPREIDLPIYFFGSADTIEKNMRRYVQLVNDTFSTPLIVVEYPDGKRFECEFHHAGGGDAQHGIDTDGRNYATWVVTLRCPKPYWVSTNAQSYALRSANAGRGLLRPGGSFSQLRLSSSQSIGEFMITNDGDVDAYPVWAIRGPGDSFRATRLVDGKSFRFKDPILSTDTITVDTENKLVTDQNGERRWTSLDTAPKLFTIPRGRSTVLIELTNATSDSLVTMYFRPRRELVF